MSQNSILRPPFNPAFQLSGGLPQFESISDLQGLREVQKTSGPTAESICEKFPHIQHTNLTIPAVQGLGDNTAQLAFFEHKTSKNRHRSVLYFAHGGGQVTGNRFFGADDLIGFFPDDESIVVASIEYRLAPEYPAPAGAYDYYAGLVYLADHATQLGIDPSKIIAFGSSGGAAIVAATALLARKRQTPQICAQMLTIPMIDDRDHWPSVGQFEAKTFWNGQVNHEAWNLILGSDRDSVNELQCAGRASDLSQLPPTFIDVGECEVFRDSAVAYASRIWKAGGSAELHVWPGVYHGASVLEPHVPVSQAQVAAQKNYIQRVLRPEAEAKHPVTII